MKMSLQNTEVHLSNHSAEMVDYSVSYLLLSEALKLIYHGRIIRKYVYVVVLCVMVIT